MKKKTTIALLLLCMLTFAFHLYLLPKMPDQVPTHWNTSGEIDGYSSKETTIFLAGLPFLLLLLFRYIPKMDPKGESYQKHEKAYTVFQVLMILFMCGVTLATDAFIFGYPVKINQVIPIGVGILLIAIGNYMPQIRQNYTMGIKTPWAIHNEWVWKKTHVMGGFTFIAMGVCMLLAGIFPWEWLANLSVIVIVGGLIWMYVYSYLMYRKWLKKGPVD